MYDPEEAFECQQLSETLYQMIDDYEEKYGDDEGMRSIVESFDQLANDYMNSYDDEEKEEIRKQALSQLKDLEEI